MARSRAKKITYPEKEKRLDALEAFRASLAADSQKAQEQFDKAMLTLAASGIGVTIAFLDKVIPFNTAIWKESLFLVWIFWGGSLTCTLISFFSSTKALRLAAKQIGDEWEALSTSETGEIDVTPANELGGFWNKATTHLNAVSLTMFIAGVFFLICFLWTNVRHAS